MSEYKKALMEYLKTASPEDWHQVAWSWNYDSGTEPLEWIVSQPNCSKGTALLIYWTAGPRYMYQYANREEVGKYNLDVYDLIKVIEEKYTSGFYQKDDIYFDPKNDYDGRDWTKEYEDEVEQKQVIPEQMFKPTSGVKIERIPLEDGYPPEVLQVVEGSE